MLHGMCSRSPWLLDEVVSVFVNAQIEHPGPGDSAKGAALLLADTRGLLTALPVRPLFFSFFFPVSPTWQNKSCLEVLNLLGSDGIVAHLRQVICMICCRLMIYLPGRTNGSTVCMIWLTLPRGSRKT